MTNNAIHCFIMGFKDVFHPKLRRYVFIPLIINFCTFVILYGISAYLFWDWFTVSNASNAEEVSRWVQWLGSLWHVIKMILAFLLLVLWFMVIGVISILCANIVGSPFNGLLSERLEMLLMNTEFEDIPILRLIGAALSRELSKWLYYLPRLIGVAVLCLLISFIPLVNIMVPVLFFIFSAWIMSLQYIDFPADNHQVKLKDMLILMRKKRQQTLLLGACFAFTSTIPLLNFFIMPACVLAATRFYLYQLTASSKVTSN